MDLRELNVESMYIRVEDGIVEFFSPLILGSLRVPLSWVGVEVRPGRHDSTQLNFGIANPAGPMMYGQSVSVISDQWGIKVDPADEARCRSFFAEIASLCGREVET
jgi:hypothetical protein